MSSCYKSLATSQRENVLGVTVLIPEEAMLATGLP